MIRRFALGLLCIFISLYLFGGVGVWTLSQNFGIGVVLAPDGTLYVGCGVDACKSTDQGNSWQQLSGPGSAYPLQSTAVLAVDPSGAVYAAVYGGGEGDFTATLYVSRDSGATWTLLRGPDSFTTFMNLSPDPFSAALFLFEGFGSFEMSGNPGYGHLFRSTDSGMHWSQIDQGISESVSAFVIDPGTSGRLYAAAAEVSFLPLPTDISSPGLFTSSDSGSTWTRLASNLPGPFLTLVLDPLHATIIGGGPSGIFQSSDGGQTFSLQSASAVIQIVTDPFRSGRFYAAAPPNGVLTSLDGGMTWAPMNTGLADLAVNEIALDPANEFLYAATLSGEFVNEIPGPGTLILDASYPFVVTLSATDPHTGLTAPGVATQVNDLWGYFSIPAITGNPNNPEVFVKLLDGTAINGEYWFFYGGLTNLEYTLTVTDSTTGKQKTYTKLAGSECGGSDTAAFKP